METDKCHLFARGGEERKRGGEGISGEQRGE